MKTVTETEILVPRGEMLRASLSYGIWIRINLILGWLTPLRFIPKVARAIGMRRQYRTKRALLTSGGLDRDLVEEWMNDNVSRVDGTEARKLRDHAVDAEKIRNSDRFGMVQKGAALLSYVLERNRTLIGSAANIGARIDPTFAYMAKAWPGTKFISIDMQNNIRESNQALGLSDNWDFASMYALDGFRNGEVRADLVYMTSTSPKFNTVELRDYLEAFRKSDVRVVIFNEPWWIFPLGFDCLGTMLPESVDPEHSRLGGFLADYQHNYLAALRRTGFTTVLCRLRPGTCSSGGLYHHLQIVAVNDAFADAFRFDAAEAP